MSEIEIINHDNTSIDKDLYDRFFDDLEKAISDGFVGRDVDITIPVALQSVLRVLKKYNAIPQEPKE